MVNSLFSLRSSALPGATTLVGFTGREDLSRPYRFEVFITLPDAAALDGALGERSTLELDRQPAYRIHGVIAEVDVLHEMRERALARLVLVPRFQLLGLTHHSRLFTEQTIPDIIQAVLEANELTSDDFVLRLGGDYAEQSHVCQYRESDLAFLSRTMEHEGIHYFFEHGDEAEKLVISDHAASHETLSPSTVRYRAGGDDVSAGDSLSRFRERRTVRPAQVVLRDYDYLSPDLDVQGEAQADRQGTGSVQMHRERFLTPDEGDRLARIRAEQLVAEQVRSRAEGTVFHLRSGYQFELGEHPIGSMNRQYLCVSLEHHANMAARTAELAEMTGLSPEVTYQVALEAMPADVPYRPRRSTPKPRIYGLESAVVDGPADSDYAQIDEHGRYHIRFRFDESNLAAGRASTAVRMMQPHAGNPEGFHFPLRKETEVLVAFLGGDPDRPVIAGAVPNAHDPTPVYAQNHTRNVIHTGGNNRFELEDQDGSQWFDVNTPVEESYLHLGEPHNPSHNWVLRTKGNCLFDFGTNQDINVGGKLEETVDQSVKETYHADQTSVVTGPQKTTVKAGVTEIYKSSQLTITGGQVTEEYKTGQTTTVAKSPRNELFCSTQTTNVSAALTQQQLTANHVRVVAGATKNMLTGTYTRQVTEAATILCPSQVSRSWGPTNSEYASLNLVVPGQTKVLCSTFEVAIPMDNWAFLSNSWNTGLKLELVGVALGATLLKIERIGLAIGNTTIKREATGAKLAGTGLELSVNVFKGEPKLGPNAAPYAIDLTT